MMFKSLLSSKDEFSNKAVRQSLKMFNVANLRKNMCV